tara:strand:+ start:325 stop:1080 length:756 start_codon:yes stop_codon:yes gene_type:complete
MSPELAEICGIHTGDGYLRIRERGKGELDISGHLEEREYYDNYVIPLINKVFKLNLNGRVFSRGTYGFVLYNKRIAEFLNGLGFPLGKKSKIVKVPELILKSKNKTLYAKFLRGLFDTDGCLHFSNRKTISLYSKFKRTYHYYPIIRFTTISKLLSKQIIFLLEDLGFNKVRIHSYQPKDLRDSRKYIIYMSGKEMLLKFFKEVESMNPVKYSRFKIWKKFGFCPPHTTLQQRKDILNDKLDIYSIYGHIV